MDSTSVFAAGKLMHAFTSPKKSKDTDLLVQDGYYFWYNVYQVKRDIATGVIGQVRHSFTWTTEDGKTHERLFKIVFKAGLSADEVETPFMIYHANWANNDLSPMPFYRWYATLDNGETVCRFAIGDRQSTRQDGTGKCVYSDAQIILKFAYDETQTREFARVTSFQMDEAVEPKAIMKWREVDSNTKTEKDFFIWKKKDLADMQTENSITAAAETAVANPEQVEEKEEIAQATITTNADLDNYKNGLDQIESFNVDSLAYGSVVTVYAKPGTKVGFELKSAYQAKYPPSFVPRSDENTAASLEYVDGDDNFAAQLQSTDKQTYSWFNMFSVDATAATVEGLMNATIEVYRDPREPPQLNILLFLGEEPEEDLGFSEDGDKELSSLEQFEELYYSSNVKIGIDISDPAWGVVNEVQVIVTPGQNMTIAYVSEENIVPAFNLLEGDAEMVKEVFTLDSCFPMEDEIEIWDEEIGDYTYEPVTLYLWLGSYKVTRAATPGNVFKIDLTVGDSDIIFEITAGMKNYDNAVEFIETLDRIEHVNMDYSEGYIGFESKVGETIGIVVTSSNYIDIFEYNQHPNILTAEMMLEGMLAYGDFEDYEPTEEERAELLAEMNQQYPVVLSEGVTRDGVTKNAVASAILDPMGTYNWLFTYTVREDAPADAAGIIFIPDQNLEDEPLLMIEVYIRGKGDVGGEGTIQSFDQLEAIWNELDSDILVNLDQTTWNFPHNAIRTQVQVGEVVGIGMHSKYDQEDNMPWPQVDNSQLDYIWPTEDFAVALLNPEPEKPDENFVWFYSAQVAEGTPVGTEINIDIMRGEPDSAVPHFRVIIEIVAVLDTEVASITETEQLKNIWDTIDSRQVIDLDNIEQGSTLRLTTGIGKSVGVLIITKKLPVLIEKMIEKREFFGPIPWLDPEPRLSEEYYYYDELLIKTNDVAKRVLYDTEYTAWFHSWTVDEYSYDMDMAHLYIFQDPKDDFTVKLEILVEQKEDIIQDLDGLMDVYWGLDAAESVDVLDSRWPEGNSELNMTVTPGQTFGILLSTPDADTEIELHSFDPDGLLSMESFTPTPLQMPRSEFTFPNENGEMQSMPDYGSDQHLAASWIVEPGLTFGTIMMDFKMKYKYSGSSDKMEQKWFNAHFNIIVTEPKVEDTSEFIELLASFNDANLLTVDVNDAIVND